MSLEPKAKLVKVFGTIYHLGEIPIYPEKGRMLSPKDLSNILRVSEATLADWRHSRRGPKYYKMGTQVRYYYTDFIEWQRCFLEPVKPLEL